MPTALPSLALSARFALPCRFGFPLLGLALSACLRLSPGLPGLALSASLPVSSGFPRLALSAALAISLRGRIAAAPARSLTAGLLRVASCRSAGIPSCAAATGLCRRLATVAYRRVLPCGRQNAFDSLRLGSDVLQQLPHVNGDDALELLGRLAGEYVRRGRVS